MIALNEELVTKIVKSDENNSNLTILNWNLDKGDIQSGANFCSDVCRLLIEYKKDDRTYKKSYFLKIPHTSPLHKYNTKYGIEIREFLIYSEFIPEMRVFHDTSSFAPKYYYADENYSMILEDLCTSGYRTTDRIEKLDFQHCQLVFKCLAKFHAYSVKFKSMSVIPEIFRRDTFFLMENPDSTHLKPVFSKAFDCFLRTFDRHLVLKYSKKLHYFKDNILHRIAEEVKGRTGCFKVLNHGDVWSNNVMFKYDKFASVERVKLIDFQLCRWASPAFDILHFSTTSMKFEVFEKYFDLLLETYLDTLNDVLRFLDCEEYKMQDFRKDIDNTYGFAILGFTVLTPVIMAESDDPVNLASILEDPQVENEALENAYRRQCYQDFARKWFMHYVKKGNLLGKSPFGVDFERSSYFSINLLPCPIMFVFFFRYSDRRVDISSAYDKGNDAYLRSSLIVRLTI